MPCRLIILLSLVGQLLGRAATAPTAEVIPLTPKHFQEYNSSKVQLSYGPFQAPYKAFEAGMKKTLLGDIAKPCSDCIVTSLQVRSSILNLRSRVDPPHSLLAFLMLLLG
jgi:hypothetical protein